MDERWRELERRWWEDGDIAADACDRACRRAGVPSPPRRSATTDLLSVLDRFARTGPLPWPPGTSTRQVAAEIHEWLQDGGEPLVLIGGLRATSTHDATLRFTSAGPVVLLGPDVLFAQPPRGYDDPNDPVGDPMVANTVTALLGPWTASARQHVHETWQATLNRAQYPAAGLGMCCLCTRNGWWYAWSRQPIQREDMPTYHEQQEQHPPQPRPAWPRRHGPVEALAWNT